MQGVLVCVMRPGPLIDGQPRQAAGFKVQPGVGFKRQVHSTHRLNVAATAHAGAVLCVCV